MFLTKMELKGFKSFAFPTTVEFKDGLTVIVGPNGSGKSNINDALKWVLGETSKKTLRAKIANDMIFSGSLTEKPAEYAKVNLYFNNKDRLLDLDFDEVVITRKSYRLKDKNEYFINHELVRRKDVKNLFLDTGLGNTDLSIISQGSVSKVMDAKPSELRQLLNEASGVSRYQIYKKEAFSKLEKVTNNLEIFEVKLQTLKRQLKPLKNAADKAKNYFEIKEKLLAIELPLIKNQLEDAFFLQKNKISEDEKLTIQKDQIDKKITTLNYEVKNNQKKLLDLDQKIVKLQVKQNELQNNFSKTIKFSGDKEQFESKIKQTYVGIKDLKQIISDSQIKEETLNKDITILKSKKFDSFSETEQFTSNLNKVNFEIERILNKSKKYDFGTAAILDNRGIFDKIYGTVQDIIKIDDKYELALNVAIGSKLKNIVVSDEQTIKDAISFLRENKYGSATFIPAFKTKAKNVSYEIKNAIVKINGFVSILSDLIIKDNQFKNLVDSLAGNIVVFENLSLALVAAKFIQYKLMIVTLDGDIIYPGFVVRGGFNNLKSTKIQLEKLQKAKQLLTTKLKLQEKNEHTIDEKISNLNNSRNLLQTEEIRLSERMNYLDTQLHQMLDSYQRTFNKEFKLNSLSSDLNQDTEQFSLEKVSNSLQNLQSEKHQVSIKIIEFQDELASLNKKWGEVVELNSSIKIELNNLNILINDNVTILNEDYKMTYDDLSNKKLPKLSLSFEDANLKRQDYRATLKSIGYIDEEAINKFKELSKEHDNLKKNVDDLIITKEKLLSTIDTMDKEMLRRINDTFVKINTKFNAIFNILFRGGNAKLLFSEPENILDSGLEIIASAPGKAVKNLTLYSGGEKSLIALSLIFAINEVRNLPLLLLDEVEAALDEANVERFANFAKILNNQTQLIIVSHRPGTMERADILYGVTMQKKGITSIFNVKLAEIDQYVK